MVQNLTSQVTNYWGGVAAFNVTQYNVAFYTVPADQPLVDVKWDDCQRKGYLPTGLYGVDGQFVGVPIPSDALPSTGTDKALTIYQPSTDKMWDFWLTSKQADGWHACWGGRMDGVSTAPGWFKTPFGTSASGLAHAGGQIGIREAEAGSIDHALSLQLIKVATSSVVSWPAQRSDGTEPMSDSAIPEGTRFRLDPSIDVASLKLHPLAAMVARAAQKYGFIVTDRSGAVAVITESGNAVKTRTGTNPWTRMLGGTESYNVMRGFPWHKMQALPKDYGKP
jgi:hypothetical protein